MDVQGGSEMASNYYYLLEKYYENFPQSGQRSLLKPNS